VASSYTLYELPNLLTGSIEQLTAELEQLRKVDTPEARTAARMLQRRIESLTKAA
jgi:hypothetical protein